jgi:hypothetical protein
MREPGDSQIKDDSGETRGAGVCFTPEELHVISAPMLNDLTRWHMDGGDFPEALLTDPPECFSAHAWRVTMCQSIIRKCQEALASVANIREETTLPGAIGDELGVKGGEHEHVSGD